MTARSLQKVTSMRNTSWLLLCAGILFFLAACNASDVASSGAAVTGAAEGEKCTVDADCRSGLECEHGACAVDEDADDDHGDRDGEHHGDGDADDDDDDDDDGAGG